MAKTFILLPGHDEMLARLKAVDDNDHLIERFYPILLRGAGRKLVPMGVVMMLTLAIYDYTLHMPSMAALMHMKMEDYIDALVTDEGAAQETKEFYKQSQERSHQRSDFSSRS